MKSDNSFELEEKEKRRLRFSAFITYCVAVLLISFVLCCVVVFDLSHLVSFTGYNRSWYW